MKLKITKFEDLKKETLFYGDAFVKDEFNALIVKSSNYELSLKRDEMTLLSHDHEKSIEGIFRPSKLTSLGISTEYGVTMFDVHTLYYEFDGDRAELKYKLMGQGQLVDTFHFEFEILSRREKS